MSTVNHRILSVLLLFVVLGSASASAEPTCEDPGSSLLWEIRGKNSTVHLFGSLHLGEASFYPLPEKIESTFRGADHVVFEVDPRSMGTPEVLAKIQQQAQLAPGEKFSDLVSQSTIDELTALSQTMGLPAEALMGFRPWYVTLGLTSIQVMSLGYVPQHGVEQYLLREIPATANILELESLDEQISFMQELDGDAFLSHTLLGFEAGKETFELLVDAWRCADKPQLTSLFLDEFDVDGPLAADMDRLKTKLLTERNQVMADKIKGYLQEGEGSYFVVVGAAHFLGEGSIVEVLQNKGYRVEAVRM